MKYKLLGNQCERRALDKERLQFYLEINGFESTDSFEDAELVIFISCGMLEANSQATIRQVALLCDNSKRLVVFGCFPSMCKQEENDKVLYVPLKNPQALDEIIGATIPLNSISYPHFVNSRKAPKADFKHWDPRIILPYCSDVYSIIVSNGCSQACSYCSIRFAVGPLKSRPIDAIVEDLERGLSLGFRLFRFQCENLGVYGSDIKQNLGDLLKAIGKIHEYFSIDLPDLHPRGFVNHFNEIVTFVQAKNVYLLHLPVQSANQRILDMMRRKYDIHEVASRLHQFRNEFPDVRLGTDIIAGFPTEAENEFEDSYQFMMDFNFDVIYLHGYNAKVGAPSAKIEPLVPQDVIVERIQRTYNTIPNVVCWLNNYELSKQAGNHG